MSVAIEPISSMNEFGENYEYSYIPLRNESLYFKTLSEVYKRYERLKINYEVLKPKYWKARKTFVIIYFRK